MKYKLQDLIDIERFQNLQDRLNKIYSFPSSIIDNDGNILTATAWQDVCTQFHRTNKDSERECIKSDQYIRDHLHEASPAVSYRCPHGLVDNATPIIIDGIHYGNFFTGQFFLDEPDLAFFRAQAQKYGFDEDAYLDALKKVPVWNQDQLKDYLSFIRELIDVISESGLKKLKEVENRKLIEAGERRHRSILKSARDGYWLTDIEGRLLEVNDAYCRMSGHSENELLNMHIPDLEAVEVPQRVAEHMKKVISQGSDRFESKHCRKDGTVFDVEVSIQFRPEEGGQCVCFLRDITERKWAEESLRESHERYQLIVENISNVVWTMDMNFHNTFVSPSVYQQRGYTPEEVKNQPLSERMNPDSIEKVLNLYSEKLKLIEAGDSEGWKPVEFEIEQPCKDGSTIWTTNTVRLLPGPDKQPASLLGTTHDITERKQSQVELKESEDKFRSFAEQSLVGIYLISGDVFKYVNPKFAEIFGYSVDECLDNMHFPQLVHPEDLVAVQKQVSRRLSGESKAVRYSFRGIKKSGETIHVEIYGSSMVLKGKTVATGTMLDITESKGAQEALRESEEKYRTILEDLEDGYFEVDIAGNLTFFNGSLCRIFGYSKDELIGMNNRQYTDEENAKKLYQTFNRVYTTGKSDKGFDWELISKDGNKILVEASISPKKDSEGQPIGFQGIVRDVSDRRKIEIDKAKLEARLQRAQKMEAIGTLAGGVAHDLNNILGGLVSYPELLLLQLSEDSPLRKSILTIQKSGEKAAAVVQDLLTLARRGVVVTEVVNLNDVISQYLKSSEYERLQSYHPAVHMETHFVKETLNISGSSTHLSKTVMNLVSNAAESMSGGGNMVLSTENRYIDRPIRGADNVKEGDYVVFTISDTGTGISPSDIEKIFEPFYTKKKMGKSGTGLGMAVVWGTVTDHNGYIDVQSTEGKGTTFTLYFPATREKLPEDKSHLAIGSYRGNGESIMVVDDVEEQRRIASGMLEELGYSVVSISSGEEAFEYLKTHKVDLLVLDMIMDPGMDGLDTYQKIIEIHPDQKAIIASGFSETGRAKEVQVLGAGVYIRKPFLLEQIGLAVKEELEK